MRPLPLAAAASPLFLLLLLLHCLTPSVADLDALGAQWINGTAGNLSAGGLGGAMAGPACGYGNIFQDGYGDFRTSASPRIFKNGALCGACFEVRCNPALQPKICPQGVSAILTVTDQCIPDVENPQNSLCLGDQQHFELPSAVFSQLTLSAKPVPIQFKRVQCSRSGGIAFQVNGSPQVLQVNIRNVAGPGTIDKVWILARGKHTWMPMTRLWGQNWIVAGNFQGKSLSFKVKSNLTNRTVIATNVAPRTWRFGVAYFSRRQFSTNGR